MKKRIFALDNEKNHLDLISALLDDDYLDVVICDNPKKAINLIIQDKLGFDLIISDIHMPGLTGFDFIDELKSHKEYYYIPVIFLTAMEDDQLRINAYKNNVFDYLVKPLNTKTFKYKILSILDNYDEVRKSAFTIKKGKFSGKIFPDLIKEAETEKWNGILMIENRSQGLCRIDIVSGNIDKIRFNSKNGLITKDDTAIDTIMKWRSALFTIYHQEIESYFKI